MEWPEYINVDVGERHFDLCCYSVTEMFKDNSLEIKGTVASKRRKPKLGIRKVIFNFPATIVFWNDGTKTVVKDEGNLANPFGSAFQTLPFWREAGLLNAICKKAYGNRYIDELRKWC